MFTPVQFGKYYLTERIAVGGMAELFKAKLFGVGGFEKQMVVKQILPKYSKNADFINMFIDEAKIAATLHHGNIVPVYELGRIDGIYFIAMEYVQGKDLSEILEEARSKKTPISAEHAAFIAIEICKGLDHAHRRTSSNGEHMGLVHRDISPPNILVSKEGEVKITDFGIAKAAHKLGSTEAGVVKGTFGYMSPEQVRGLPVDHHTDIFSAGILLHEMLTGRRLFTGDSELEAIERVKEAKVSAPSSINPHVPAALDPIVFKALAREPTDRYSDASEFQLALSRFLFTAGKGATATTLSRYMLELFGEELQFLANHGDNGHDAPVDLILSQRPELEFHSGPLTLPETPLTRSASGRSLRRTPVDLGAGAGLKISETLALPAITDEQNTGLSPSTAEAEQDLLAPLPVLSPVDQEGDLTPLAALPSDAELDDEEEQTIVFKQAHAPQRPEVPVLRIPAHAQKASRQEIVAKIDEVLEAVPQPTAEPRLSSPQNEGKPLTFEPATPPGEEVVAPFERADLPATAEGAAPALTTTAQAPTVEAGLDLVGLLAGTANEASSPLTQATAATFSIKNEARKEDSSLLFVEPISRKKKISGILSSTMRLFVDGLEEDPSSPTPTGPGAEPLTEGIPPITTDLVDRPSRRIKPTWIGWFIIGLLVLGAGALVMYKKTSLFSNTVDEDAELLKPEDIQPEIPEPQKKLGTVQLSAKPGGVSFYRFMGETPVILDKLDRGQSHLLLVEREGYQSVFKLVEPSMLKGDQQDLTIPLNPVGPGAQQEKTPPAITGTPTGQKGSVSIKSDPPMAMIWLFLNQGDSVIVPDVDTSKSADFKVLLPGYRPGIIHVSSVDFEGENLTYSTVVTLEKDSLSMAPTDAQPRTTDTTRGQAGSPPPATTVTERPVPPRPSPTTTRKDTKQHRPSHSRPRRPGPRSKTKPKSKILTPSWAQ